MDWRSYYGRVLRETFRHAWSISDGLNGVFGVAAAALVHFRPGAERAVSEFYWQAAIWVFGAVVGIRLLLAPYWVWKTDQAKYGAMLDEYAYNLSQTTGLEYKIFTNKETGEIDREEIDITLYLENKTQRPMEYSVVELSCQLNDTEIDVSNIMTRGGVIPKGSQYLFRLPTASGPAVSRSGWFRLRYVILFGPPEAPFARRMTRQEFVEYHETASDRGPLRRLLELDKEERL